MIKKYFACYSNKHVSHWLVFSIDVAMVAFTFYLSYIISFNLSFNIDLNEFLNQLPVVLLSASVGFLIVGSYKNAIRHTGFSDLISVFKSVALMFSLLTSFIFISQSISIIPNFTISFSVLIIHSLLTLIFLSYIRLILKSFYKNLMSSELTERRVLVYGVNHTSIATYHALINNVLENIKVIGFINDCELTSNKHINSIPVLVKSKITQEFIKTNSIDEVVISSKDHDGSHPFISKGLNVKATTVLPIQSWINGELTLNKSKHFPIEELLGRAPIKIDNTNVAKEFIGETLLITGATGAIGRGLINHVINFNVKKIILIDQSEADLYDLQQDLKHRGKHNVVTMIADISDGLRIDMLFQEYRPTVIFHAAEYSNEQLMEKSPYEAIKININGTKFLADTASRYNVKKFVFISSDKAVNPSNSIGVTKRLAELYITCLQKESQTKFIITRCGNIIDSKCSIVSHFEKQIKNGGPITIPHRDMTRYFTTLSEVVELILEAGTMGRGGEIFIFDTGQPIKIYDMAKRMINLSGLNYPDDITIKVTGLNSGEKIHDEFMATIENPTYTYHKKVMIFITHVLNYNKIKSEIEELCFVNRFQHNDIVVKMKKLISEGESNNSEYNRLYKRVQSYKRANGILPEKTNQIKSN